MQTLIGIPAHDTVSKARRLGRLAGVAARVAPTSRPGAATTPWRPTIAEWGEVSTWLGRALTTPEAMAYEVGFGTGWAGVR